MAVERFDLGRRKRLALALSLFTGQVCVLGPPDDQRRTVERAQRGSGAGELSLGGRAVELEHGSLGGPGTGRVIDAIDLIARQPGVLAPEQQPERRAAGCCLEDLAETWRPPDAGV